MVYHSVSIHTEFISGRSYSIQIILMLLKEIKTVRAGRDTSISLSQSGLQQVI